MVIIDTSAWIEYFNNGDQGIITKIDYYLDNDHVAIGDLIYCEIMQGISSDKQRKIVSDLLSSLIQLEMVGFKIAKRASDNYRLLRSRGITVRKTIDMIIGSYCVENNIGLVHNDRDFTLMSSHIGLKLL